MIQHTFSFLICPISRTPDRDFRCFFPSHTPIPALGKDEELTATRWLHLDPWPVIMLKWRHHVASQHIQDFLKVFFKFLPMYKSGIKWWARKRIHNSCEDGIEKCFPRITDWHHEACRVMTIGDRKRRIFPSLAITDCHHLASLVMSTGDPWDAFFYPTLILKIDSHMHDSYHLLLHLLMHFGSLYCKHYRTLIRLLQHSGLGS